MVESWILVQCWWLKWICRVVIFRCSILMKINSFSFSWVLFRYFCSIFLTISQIYGIAMSSTLCYKSLLVKVVWHLWTHNQSTISHTNSPKNLKITFLCVISVLSQKPSNVFGLETGFQQCYLTAIYDKSLVIPSYSCIGTEFHSDTLTLLLL